MASKQDKRHIRTAQMSRKILMCLLISFIFTDNSIAQHKADSIKQQPYNSVIRYNLTGGLIFGFERYVVLGYERKTGPRQSVSVNLGKVALPRLISITTDSFSVKGDRKNTGTNFSIDYRFYLRKENKYLAPHGLYIGPYYSYNRFVRDNQWNFRIRNSDNYISTHTDFKIHTAGIELGYQFILWRRLTLDFAMIGPGVGFYHYKATFDSSLDEDTKQQLRDGLEQMLTQKFPGMNYVFSEKQIDANGTLKTTSIGYRYLIHVGYNF